MSNIAISANNLSKVYRIGATSVSLRQKISNIHRILRKEKDSNADFWALKDISFQIEKGDVVGIIGRNGAGKSTLLKILSRITYPSKGKFEITGRVASLLEVGTGFHPELTGRENIFLNGTILGMHKKEIKAKFDEMIDFSGVEKFIDTPVKHYSSGMYVRLAFAVAAHLEPEILIIDEVLAVGDASFQRKCFNKMQNISYEGRTVLLVSHNLAQVQSLCRKGILLQDGKLAFMGDINQAVLNYVNDAEIKSDINVLELPRAGIKSNELTISRLKIDNQHSTQYPFSEKVQLQITYIISSAIEELVLGFSITDMLGNLLLECRSTSNIRILNIKEPGEYVSQVEFELPFNEGIYNINLGARCLKGHLEYVPNVMRIEIVRKKDDFEEWNKPCAGIFAIESSWIVSKVENGITIC